MSRDLINILSKRNPNKKHNYVVVSCQNTSIEGDEISDFKFPPEWKGLFSADFFVNEGGSIRVGDRFTMQTTISKMAEGDYKVTFEGNKIQGHWSGELEKNVENIEGKSVTAIKLKSEGRGEVDLVFPHKRYCRWWKKITNI